MKKLLLIFLAVLPVMTKCQDRKIKVIAYYTGNGETLAEYPLKKITHLIYSFLHLRNDSLTYWNDRQRTVLLHLSEVKKQYPHLKIMVSLGGWGGCAPCSEIFATQERRDSFALSVVSLLKEFNLDGLDLDWEYPAIEGYPGHAYDSSDKAHFTSLVKTLRLAFGTEYLLSFAAGGFEKYLTNSIEWAEVMPQVDFVNLMTYDLVSGFSKLTGHHTPLLDYQPDQQSTSKCVTWLLGHQVKKEQLVIGAAFYARVWSDVISENHGLYNPGNFKEMVSFRNFDTYFSDTTGFSYFWDKKAKAPYYYNESKQLFATFDDKHSVAAKMKFIRRNKLGGIMFWELTDDKNSKGLLDTIYKKK